MHGCNENSLELYFPWTTEAPYQPKISTPFQFSEMPSLFSWSDDIGSSDEHLLASFNVTRALTAAVDEASVHDTKLDKFAVYAATEWILSRLASSSLIPREPLQQCLHISFCLGIQIYLTTIVDQFAELGLSQLDLVSRLASSLSCMEVPVTKSPFLLWTVFFGGIAAEKINADQEMIDLLRDMLCDISRASNICGWESLHLALKSLCWLDTRHSEPGRQFWGSVSRIPWSLIGQF